MQVATLLQDGAVPLPLCLAAAELCELMMSCASESTMQLLLHTAQALTVLLQQHRVNDSLA